MCYSGRCKYETYSGDCSIYSREYPKDALCEIDEDARIVREGEEFYKGRDLGNGKEELSVVVDDNSNVIIDKED